MLKRMVMVSTFLVLVGSMLAVGPAHGQTWLWPCQGRDLAGGEVTLTFCDAYLGVQFVQTIRHTDGGAEARFPFGPAGDVVLTIPDNTWPAPGNALRLPWVISNTTPWNVETVYIDLLPIPCTRAAAFDTVFAPPPPMVPPDTPKSMKGWAHQWTGVGVQVMNRTYPSMAQFPNNGDMRWDLLMEFNCPPSTAALGPGQVHEFWADTDRWTTGDTPPDCGDDECGGSLSSGVIGFTASEDFAGVLVQWMSQSDNAGFNLYRSVGSSGNYELLNGGLLKSESYVDTDVMPGLTYYYQLGVVDLNGNEELYGPVSIAVQQISWGALKGIYR